MNEADRQVPLFEAAVLANRRTHTCVIVPVLDEGDRIRRQLARMAPYLPAADVVIADGGSRDGSVDPAAMAGLGVRAVLTKTGPGFLSAQMRMGLAWALDEGYQGMVLIDGNDKDDPSAIPRFVDALDRGFDHVQGSRYAPGGHEENTPLSRKWGVRLLHAPLVSMAAGFRYTDTTNGFRAYSRRLLLDDRVAPFRDVFSRYELHYYLAIRAARLGFRVCELPVTRSYPARGLVPTRISPIRGNLADLGALARACLHRFDPE